MGCDIHSYAEVRHNGRWRHADGPIVTPIDEWADPSEPFGWRGYNMFGFLAGVRNRNMPLIREPRGLPDDVSDEVRNEHGGDPTLWHSASWLTLAELLDYDYDQPVSSVRWEGLVTGPLRDVLGETFFQHLNDLGKLGAPEDVRVVFWFDS